MSATVPVIRMESTCDFIKEVSRQASAYPAGSAQGKIGLGAK